MSQLLLHNVHAPIRHEIIGGHPENDGSSLPSASNPEIPESRTRSGYLISEAYSCYEQALGESGAAASGKALHFAADLVCSGGLDIWIRGAYSYSIQRIGLANPRIFVYLKQRIGELDKLAAKLPIDLFYKHPDVQGIISEVVLVLQLCPKHTKIAWPKIEDATRRPNWIRGVASAPETAVTRKVWVREGDSQTLYLLSNELCKAIVAGETPKALFWIRWAFEEDARCRKENMGAGLSRRERGPPTATTEKAKTDVGHFLAGVLLETYREFASKNLIRMNEEFAELIRLWRDGEKRMAPRLKRECLGWMAMICCEVPRWKVPAAPVLVSDPTRLARAVAQGGAFFNEVLAYAPVNDGKEIKPSMTKAKRVKKEKPLTEKEEKEKSLLHKMDAYDAVLDAYLQGK